MAANTSPIFTLTPTNGFCTWTNSTTANTKNDGTGTIGTDILVAYTAGANGAFINKVRLLPCASTAGTSTTGTVGRIYRSTKASGSTTNADTFRIDEVNLPSQLADQATTATNFVEIPIAITLAATETILFSMHHAAAANTVWQCIVYGNNY